ncbi:MAG TPA: hypothetical protein VMH90_02575 [Thermoplasmata archaeon]|nr:hypothetical protein [Thermoplasmata archaeon]
MPDVEVLSRRLVGWLAGTVGVALVAIAAILADVGPGVVVHELAGTVLLLLLVGGLDLAFRLRRADARPLVRVVIALLALVFAGATGAGLALGALGRVLDGLPLLPLAVLLLALLDAIRIARRIGPALPPGAGGPVPPVDP